MDYAVLDAEGTIVNRVVRDEGAAWEPDEGFTIEADAGNSFEIGGSIVGGVYAPPVRPDPLPMPPVTKVSLAQAKVAIYNAGLLGEVNAAIALSYEPIKIYWQYASDLERYHPYTLGIQALLGYSDEKMDALFLAASVV